MAAPKLVLAGDSTVATVSKPRKDRPDLAGWGQMLPDFLTPEATVVNHARGGTSTKSFRALGLWDRVLAEKPDYVLIQFGHNDQPGKGPDRETDPAGSYRENLRQFIREELDDEGLEPALRERFLGVVRDEAAAMSRRTREAGARRVTRITRGPPGA